MPRRTHPPRRKRRRGTEHYAAQVPKPSSTAAMARDLVKRGLASPLILDRHEADGITHTPEDHAAHADRVRQEWQGRSRSVTGGGGGPPGPAFHRTAGEVSPMRGGFKHFTSSQAAHRE